MTGRRHFRAVAFATAAALAGVACGGTSSGESASDPESSTQIENAAAPGILQFTNALVGGGDFDASTLADKPTLFWFWSPT